MKLRAIPLHFLLCFSLFELCVLAGPLDHWEWRNPRLTGISFRGIASGHGRLIAVGDRGVMLSSTNGADWELSRRDINLSTIAFGNGVFVAAGDGSAVLVSSNGTDWTQHVLDGADSFSRISFHEDKFLIAGYGDSLLISTNGIDWRAQQVGYFSFWWGAAARGNTTVLVGDEAVIVSTNGSDWNEVDPATTESLFSVTWTTTKGFVAVGWNGLIVTSSNGLNWVNQSLTAPPGTLGFQAVREQGGVALVAGWGGAISDGGGFEIVNYFGQFQFNALAYAWGAHWGVGYGGCIATSSDGRNWVSLNPGIPGMLVSNPLIGAVFGNDGFLAVGAGQAVVSQNGVDWSVAGQFKPRTTDDVAFGNGRFVAVGMGLRNDPTSISSSADGTNWTAHPAPYDVVRWERASFAGGKFIAVGRPGYLAVSTNGSDWVFSNTNGWTGFGLTVLPPALTRVVHGNGKYMLGTHGSGANGVFFTSDDGLTWSSNSVPNIWKFNDLVFGNGKFVGAGVSSTGGHIITSVDGFSWQQQEIQAFHLIFAGGMFVAVSGDAVWSSTDAEQWVRHPIELPLFAYDIAYGQDTFVIVGDFAGIVQSAPLSYSPRLFLGAMAGAGAPVIRLAAPIGYTFTLEASADLMKWAPVGPFRRTNGFLEAIDPANLPIRFYRVR